MRGMGAEESGQSPDYPKGTNAFLIEATEIGKLEQCGGSPGTQASADDTSLPGHTPTHLSPSDFQVLFQ